MAQGSYIFVHTPRPAHERIEQALEACLDRAGGIGGAPRLAQAMRHAVYPGGARVRPHLCLAVAQACGDDQKALTDAVAAAIELLHCASLVHDYLPCFDNADTRRGQPSVHAAFGEALAVLAGDALIVAAFEAIARAGVAAPGRIGPLIALIARKVGAPSGLCSGQAWESEPAPPLTLYHQQKTAAMFVAATMGGAIAAGADPRPWRILGERLGAAYQVADDLLDVLAGDGDLAGKPIGQDQAHRRPNAVAVYGVEGAVAMVRRLVAAAVDAVPPCAGRAALVELVRAQATRLAPQHLAVSAA